MPAISKKTFLGLALETTPGTAITTPVRYIPCKSTIKAERKPEYTDDDRNSRDANFTVTYGTRKGGVDVKGNWYNDACATLLYALMGGYAVSQPDATHVPTVYKHTFSMADVPPTYTLVKSYATETYYASYSALEKFSLKFSADKTLEYDASFTTRFPLTTTQPSPAFTTLQAFPGYAGTFTLTTLGASTTDIIDFDIAVEQKIDTWTPGSGTPDYVSLYFGERKVTGGFTARFDVNTLAANWRNTTDDSLTFDIQGALIANSGSSGTPPNTNYNQELNISLPIISYDSFDWDESKVNVTVKVKFTARPKADLSQPVMSAFVQNTVSTYANG
jgi:hypothetical protein